MQWEDDVLEWARAEGCTAPLLGNYSDNDYTDTGSNSEPDIDSDHEGANASNEDEN
jgi:hypothetical protein